MLYAIISEDVPDSSPLRKVARPDHIKRLDELLAQPENEDLAAHFSYPWPGGHESVYVAR